MSDTVVNLLIYPARPEWKETAGILGIFAVKTDMAIDHAVLEPAISFYCMACLSAARAVYFATAFFLPDLHSSQWHPTTDWKITTPTDALKPAIIPLYIK